MGPVKETAIEFGVLDLVEPPQRMELSDGCIRNVYMQGWITTDNYEVCNDFLANAPEQNLTELETALGRRVRKSLCGDRHALWRGLSGIYILPTDVPRIVDYPASSHATSTRTAGPGATDATGAPGSSSAGAQGRSRRGPYWS